MAHECEKIEKLNKDIFASMEKLYFKNVKGVYSFERWLLVILHKKYNMGLIIYWQLYMQLQYINIYPFCFKDFISFSAPFVFSDKEIGIRKKKCKQFYGNEKENDDYPYC